MTAVKPQIPTPVARSLMAMQDVASTLAATARNIEAQYDEVQRQYRQAVRDAAKAHGRTGAVQEWIDLLHLNVTVTLTDTQIQIRSKIGWSADCIFALEILHHVSTLPLVGDWNGTPFDVRPEHPSVDIGLEHVYARISRDRSSWTSK